MCRMAGGIVMYRQISIWKRIIYGILATVMVLTSCDWGTIFIAAEALGNPSGFQVGFGTVLSGGATLTAQTNDGVGSFYMITKQQQTLMTVNIRPDFQTPLTLEFDQSVFNNEESVRKLGMLVKTYIALGGHQLQLNTVSREKLLDAKVHPERHRNLIVRVWGWSGYFVELDECYQNHVINRIEFGL